MKISAELAKLQERLGHAFSRPELLVRAVTHPSKASVPGDNNQRLEFLGDRVLGLVVAEALTERDPQAREGSLALRLNALVRKETCAEVAEEIGLGAALRLGRSETTTGGRRKTAVLGDAMEAVIGAVHADAGYAKARRAVLRLWGNRIDDSRDVERDAKSALQEWAMARGLPPPAYAETARSGPSHAPSVTVEAQLEGGELESATAGSKRHAEQKAAAALLERLGEA